MDIRRTYLHLPEYISYGIVNEHILIHMIRHDLIYGIVYDGGIALDGENTSRNLPKNPLRLPATFLEVVCMTTFPKELLASRRESCNCIMASISLR